MDFKEAKVPIHPSSDKVTRVVHCLGCHVDIAEMSGGKFDLDLALEAGGRHEMTAFVRPRREHEIVTVNVRTGIVTDGITDIGGYDN